MHFGADAYGSFKVEATSPEHAKLLFEQASEEALLRDGIYLKHHRVLEVDRQG